MFEEYEERIAGICQLKLQLKTQEDLMSAYCKRMREEHGQGPHMVGGKELFIYCKGETFFFAKRRGRIKKEASIHPV